MPQVTGFIWKKHAQKMRVLHRLVVVGTTIFQTKITGWLRKTPRDSRSFPKVPRGVCYDVKKKKTAQAMNLRKKTFVWWYMWYGIYTYIDYHHVCLARSFYKIAVQFTSSKNNNRCWTQKVANDGGSSCQSSLWEFSRGEKAPKKWAWLIFFFWGEDPLEEQSCQYGQ